MSLIHLANLQDNMFSFVFGTPLLVIFLIVVTLPGHLHYWCKLHLKEKKLKKKYRKQLFGVCNTAKFCIDPISSSFSGNITNTSYFTTSLCTVVSERANIVVYRSAITPRLHSACLSSMSGDRISPLQHMPLSDCRDYTTTEQSKAKCAVQDVKGAVLARRCLFVHEAGASCQLLNAEEEPKLVSIPSY